MFVLKIIKHSFYGVNHPEGVVVSEEYIKLNDINQLEIEFKKRSGTYEKYKYEIIQIKEE